MSELWEEIKQEGIEIGLAEGEARGKAEGLEQAKLDAARKMLEKNMPLDLIIEITGLTKEVINNLKLEIA